MPTGVVGDLARHPSNLRRLAPGPDLDPPAHRPRIKALERSPGRVAAKVELPWPLRNHRDLNTPQRIPVRPPHGLQQALELLIHSPRQVASPLGRQHVHQAALDPALLALGRLEAIDRLVELPPPPVDQRRETLHLGILGEALRPSLIPRRARRLVGVLRPDNRPLLLLPLRLGLAQLPLKGLYGRGHRALPFFTKTHMLVGILQHRRRLWDLRNRCEGRLLDRRTTVALCLCKG